ncbi:MAG: sugar transferase [Patescibacteria group bacterium]
MQVVTRKGTLILLAGDLFLFIVALWLALFVRNASTPDWATLSVHLSPFALVFAVWILVFFIADLYGRQTSLFQRRLPQIIFNAQLVNSGLAVIFFYFLPYFGITPKTILFIDLIWSFVLIFAWRRFLVPHILRGRRERIYFACSGSEVEELKDEIRNNPQYNAVIVDTVPVADLSRSRVTLMVINPYDSEIGTLLKDFYQLIFKEVRFLSVDSLYEDIFERVPLSLIDERWFLQNITSRPKFIYDFLKRVIDFLLALVLALISAVVYPIILLLQFTFDRGPLFSIQRRVGEKNQPIRLFKFRTMEKADDGGVWHESNKNQVTKLGAWLRKTRLDELPQLLNVLWGDISLVGPRPEFPEPVKEYVTEIPFYNVRHLVKPGLSGWAQVYQENHPHHGLDFAETRNKLSYDLFYIKNRNLWLDIAIALKTIKTLVLTKGK